MTLADQIINSGRWNADGTYRLDLTADQHKQLRNELLEYRQLRAAAENRERYEISVCAWNTGEGADTDLRHNHCNQAIAQYEDDAGGPVIGLAELVRRADQHTEDCR